MMATHRLSAVSYPLRYDTEEKNMLTLNTDRLLKVLVQNDVGAENEGGPNSTLPAQLHGRL